MTIGLQFSRGTLFISGGVGIADLPPQDADKKARGGYGFASGQASCRCVCDEITDAASGAGNARNLRECRLQLGHERGPGADGDRRRDVRG